MGSIISYSHTFEEWKQKEVVRLDEDAADANVDVKVYSGTSSPEQKLITSRKLVY